MKMEGLEKFKELRQIMSDVPEHKIDMNVGPQWLEQPAGCALYYAHRHGLVETHQLAFGQRYSEFGVIFGISPKEAYGLFGADMFTPPTGPGIKALVLDRMDEIIARHEKAPAE